MLSASSADTTFTIPKADILAWPGALGEAMGLGPGWTKYGVEEEACFSVVQAIHRELLHSSTGPHKVSVPNLSVCTFVTRVKQAVERTYQQPTEVDDRHRADSKPALQASLPDEGHSALYSNSYRIGSGDHQGSATRREGQMSERDRVLIFVEEMKTPL